MSIQGSEKAHVAIEGIEGLKRQKRAIMAMTTLSVVTFIAVFASHCRFGLGCPELPFVPCRAVYRICIK
jgi:hypothetical protein